MSVAVATTCVFTSCRPGRLKQYKRLMGFVPQDDVSGDRSRAARLQLYIVYSCCEPHRQLQVTDKYVKCSSSLVAGGQECLQQDASQI